MKILRITAQGLPLFKEDLDICFYTQQRVSEDDKDSLGNCSVVCALAALTVRKHKLEGKNPIGAADLEWIFACSYEGAE